MWDKTIDAYFMKAFRYVICQVLGALVAALYTHRETVAGYIVIVVALIIASIAYYIFVWYNWVHSKEEKYEGRTYKGAAYLMEYDIEEKICWVYGDYRLVPLYTGKPKKEDKCIRREIGKDSKVITFLGKRYITEDKEKGYWEMLKGNGIWKVLELLLFCILEWSVIYFFEPKLSVAEVVAIVIFVTVAMLPNFRWREG